MTDKVAIVDIGTDGYGPALDKALDLISFNMSEMSGRSVVMKPNLCNLRGPETGSTTDVDLVESLVKILLRNGCSKIAIIESDHWVATADEEFSRLGYREMANRNNVHLINLSKSPSYRIKLNGERIKETKVPKEILQYDFFITVPKLKTHWDTAITCALKNQFGTNPRKYKSEYHTYLAEALVDLNRLYWPRLVVVDGNFVEVRDGVAKRCGLVLVGTDPVTVDFVVAQIFKTKPERIPYLNHFLKSRETPLKVEVLGKDVSECLIEASCKLPTLPFRLANTIVKVSKKMSEIGGIGIGLAGLMQDVSHYLADTPPHLIPLALIRGYRMYRFLKGQEKSTGIKIIEKTRYST